MIADTGSPVTLFNTSDRPLSPPGAIVCGFKTYLYQYSLIYNPKIVQAFQVKLATFVFHINTSMNLSQFNIITYLTSLYYIKFLDISNFKYFIILNIFEFLYSVFIFLLMLLHSYEVFIYYNF